MTSAIADFTNVPGRTLTVLTACLGAFMLVVGAVCFVPGVVAPLLGLCCLTLLVGISRTSVTLWTLSYVIADHACQFLKRAVFLLGPQSVASYYGFQLVTTFTLLCAIVCGLHVISKYKLPASAVCLLAYVGISTLESLLNPSSTAFFSRLAGLNQSVLPLLALFIGIALPRKSWKKLSGLLLVLIVVSTVYGLFQFVNGPTAVDRAWASATHDYSMEAWKVYGFMVGAYGDFRPFSYYADHTTWGFFLVSAVIALLAFRQTGSVSVSKLFIAILFTLTGILIAETRSVWLGLVAAFAVHKLIQFRIFRRPLLIVFLLFVSFGLVVYFGQYLLSHAPAFVSSNALVSRYMTVGTISARIHAPELFVQLLPSYWLVGSGFGSNSSYSALDPSLRANATALEYSHNFLVDQLLYVGLPGLLSLLAFFYLWLREAFWVVTVADHNSRAVVRWIIAGAIGMLLTGAIQGGMFMNTYFFILLGIVTGQVIRHRAERAQALAVSRALVGTGFMVGNRYEAPASVLQH